jgi:hypothetical protein
MSLQLQAVRAEILIHFRKIIQRQLGKRRAFLMTKSLATVALQ